jgi:NAD(P)-dependent dehydrogenase (short-subunit alcohol dehydrogenase family)
MTEAAAQHALSRYGLVGKKCLVTGATKGIGRAIVEEYCALGAEVTRVAAPCCPRAMRLSRPPLAGVHLLPQ